MITQVEGKYNGSEFGELINEDGLTANLFRSGERAYKVFNRTVGKVEVYSEALKTAAAEEAGIPVARIRQTLWRDGHWALEMDYVQGDNMLKMLLQAISQGDMDKAYALVEQLAALHYQIHAGRAYEMPRYSIHIQGMIRCNASLSQAQKDRLLSYLEGMPDGNCLLHGDFHPGNVIFTANSPVILDWFTAGIGPPACDVARTYLNMKHPPVPWGSDELDIHGHYFRAYSRLSGMELDDIRRWFPLVSGMTCGGFDPVFNRQMRQYLI